MNTEVSQFRKDIAEAIETTGKNAIGYVQIEAGLAALRERFAGVVYPVATTAGLADAKAERITGELLALETTIQLQIKKREDEIEAEKAEKARLEAERIAGIRAKIEDMRRARLRQAEDERQTAARAEQAQLRAAVALEAAAAAERQKKAWAELESAKAKLAEQQEAIDRQIREAEDIAACVANHFGVSQTVAVDWLASHEWILLR